MKIKAILFLLFASFCASAQTFKHAGMVAFDKAEYYPDSVIKCVYKIKNNVYEGYAIEFDKNGQAISIGKYAKGQKTGGWNNSDGTFDTYRNGKCIDGYMPGCGTGTAKAKQAFQQLYQELMAPADKSTSRPAH